MEDIKDGFDIAVKPVVSLSRKGEIIFGEVSVLTGNGLGAFGSRTDYLPGGSPVFLAVGDLNHDGRPDLVTANGGTNTVTAMINRHGVAWESVPFAGAVARAVSVRAWPSPARTETAVSFALPGSSNVSVCVYDVSGRLVSTLARGTMTAGIHETRWDLAGGAGAKVTAGIYIVELRAGAERSTTRVAVLR